MGSGVPLPWASWKVLSQVRGRLALYEHGQAVTHLTEPAPTRRFEGLGRLVGQLSDQALPRQTAARTTPGGRGPP